MPRLRVRLRSVGGARSRPPSDSLCAGAVLVCGFGILQMFLKKCRFQALNLRLSNAESVFSSSEPTRNQSPTVQSLRVRSRFGLGGPGRALPRAPSSLLSRWEPLQMNGNTFNVNFGAMDCCHCTSHSPSSTEPTVVVMAHSEHDTASYEYSDSTNSDESSYSNESSQTVPIPHSKSAEFRE